MLTSLRLLKRHLRSYISRPTKKSQGFKKTDLCLFYTACTRSVIDYAAPVFHFALPKYLSYEPERIQRRALRIICPLKDYHEALTNLGLPTIAENHDSSCKRTFDTIIKDSEHKIRNLLPPVFSTSCSLREARRYTILRCKTKSLKIASLYLHAFKFILVK